MSDATYVTTSLIKKAATGHELEILSKIGIDWQNSSGHIDCPYPDHGGKNDWRWDIAKGRAFCTCIGKRPGEKASHSIFDVVAIKLDVDFETAKVRIAEAMGWQDMIKSKSVVGLAFQKTDAASLLSPPSASRDDTLPRNYLAHRLGVAPIDAPDPTTPMAGIKALGYYDPPTSKTAKPKPVGEFPCAVFGTVSADGRAHAHRIYTAPGGHGKAALGIGPNGHPRDAKKSAKVVGDISTSGCSVLWGDPTRAPWAIVCEGIETAAAVALSFAAEIAAGELVVAAAISATGVEAFKVYPAMRRVTVGADRDEAAKPTGRTASYRGEQAARKFGLRNHELVAVSIALPGSTGESADWLDVLARDGIEAVRAGILGAAAYVPTFAELETAAKETEQASEQVQITEKYPLPVMDRLDIKYMRTQSGVVKIHRVTGMIEGVPVWEPIATPFGVSARLRYADQADAYGLRVVVQGMDGHPRYIDFDRGELARMAGAEIRSRLFDAGLRVEDQGDLTALTVLKAADPEREIVVVSRAGWHRLNDGEVLFVSPGGDIVGAGNGITLELTANARMAMLAKAGTLDGWKAAIAAAVGARDCPHWIIGTLAGFAGPIVALTGLDTCGINLSGLSSAGKSMAQRMAVSVWTSPKLGAGLFQSMRTTENALESLAQSSNGTILALDEMGHADGKSIGRMIYSIASGVGKSRASRDAKLRDRVSWSTFSFFSGECSIEEKIRGDGGEFMAGMAVRITDIDVTGVNRAAPSTTLDAIAAINQNHGHAGPAFVQGLVDAGLRDDPEQLRAAVLATAAKLAGEGADSARIRAATPLAILHVAGSLAQRFGLLPASTQIGLAIKWAWDKFVSSSDALSLDPAELAIRSIRGWIAERWDVTIKHVDAALDTDDRAMRLNNREAVGWYDATTVYIPVVRVREAAGKSVKEQQIGQILDQNNLLARRHDAKRVTLRSVPRIGKIDCYALKRSEFGRSDRSSPDLHVIAGGAA